MVLFRGAFYVFHIVCEYIFVIAFDFRMLPFACKFVIWLLIVFANILPIKLSTLNFQGCVEL